MISLKQQVREKIVLFELNSRASKWKISREMTVLRIKIKKKVFCNLPLIILDNCPYLLPELKNEDFWPQTPTIQVSNRIKIQNFYLYLRELYQRTLESEERLRENGSFVCHEKKLIEPMMIQFFEQVINENLCVEKIGTRSLNVGCRIISSEADLEIHDGSETVATIELKDRKNPSSADVGAQLVAAMIALAQTKLHKAKGTESIEIYGITIVDYFFNFYVAHFEQDFLKAILAGNRPEQETIVYKSKSAHIRGFSLLDYNDRLNIFCYLNLIMKN